MPKISIIIPIYNREKVIVSTITKALTQSLTDIEIICVDDGSTDNSLLLLQEFAHKESRVKVLHQENGGAGSARNRGIKEACGSYLFFLDSDDEICEQNTLELLYNTAIEQKTDVCGGELVISSGGNTWVEEKTQMRADSFIKYSDYQHDYFFTRFIYKREVLVNNSICFPLLRKYEDPVFFVQVMAVTRGFFQTNIPVYLYNRRRDLTVDLPESVLIDYLKGLNLSATISKQNEWKFLHYEVFNRVRFDVCPAIETLYPDINNSFIRELMISNAVFDFSILHEFDETLNNDFLFYPLESIIVTSKKYFRIRNNKLWRCLRKKKR